MQLQPGTTLQQYRITGKLGEGGMGVVWKATDTSLDRDAAIKVLPEAFAADAERLARFEREARTLASLSHPNIAAVYGLHRHESQRFIAMEYVDGEDLAQRLERGPLPVDEALALARQIADALEAAHERGVIHRDLKPANVKLTPEAKIKVLDFGLAKAVDAGAASGITPDQSPTVTSAGTLAGTILGTAAYMSPEQAKGKPVDRRADIWAFGVMLWEMLTGRRLFAGDNISETIAAVLMSEPDLDALPADTPPRIRRLIERCLRREPASRLRDIGDARVVLEESLAAREWTGPVAASGTATAGSRRWLPAAMLAAGLAVGAGLASFLMHDGAAPSSAVNRLAIPLEPGMHVAGPFLLTPDGRTAVFRAVGAVADPSDRDYRIHVRRLDGDELVEVPGSRAAIGHALSPDGGWLAFVRTVAGRGELMKLPLDLSAPPLKLADWPETARNTFVWAAPDRIYGLSSTEALLVFPADGGPPERIELDGTPFLEMWLNDVLPGGEKLLVHVGAFRSGAYRQDIGVLDVATGAVTFVLDDGSWPRYVDGRLVFSRRGALLAAPFDPRRTEPTGGARVVGAGLWARGPWTGGVFGIAGSGDLIYGAGEVQGGSRFISLVTAGGEATPWSDDRLHLNSIWASPDGAWIAVQLDNIEEGDALLQIRASPIDRPRLRTVGAQPGMDCGYAAWSTVGLRLAYACATENRAVLHVVSVEAGGSSVRLLELTDGTRIDAIAGFDADASHVIVEQRGPQGFIAFLAVPVDGSGGDVGALVLEMQETQVYSPRVSADGRWLTYVSVETGRREQFVRELIDGTALGPRHLVPGGGGVWAWWSKRAQGERYELLKMDDQRIWAIDLDVSGSTPRFAEPRMLGIDGRALGMGDADSLPDGNFVMIRIPDSELGSTSLRLVQNWSSQLE